MRKFDTKVQHLKYKVLREVARQAWNDTLLEKVLEIPNIIIPGNEPTMRCCVYKERAILSERVKLAMRKLDQSAGSVSFRRLRKSQCSVFKVYGKEKTRAFSSVGRATDS